MDLIIFISIYVLAAFVATYRAYQKRLNWLMALVLSLFLTPVAGFIYSRTTKAVRIFKEQRYKCPRCNFYFTEPHAECPYCKKDGHTIHLRKLYVDMT